MFANTLLALLGTAILVSYVQGTCTSDADCTGGCCFDDHIHGSTCHPYQNISEPCHLSGSGHLYPCGCKTAAQFEVCPHGSTQHGDSCYLIGHLLANWPDALVYCEAYLGHLVHIESSEEQQFVASMLLSSSGAITDKDKYLWIGGTDAVSEGVWIWEKTVNMLQYTNWKPGEPNNDHHQDCLAVLGETGYWDDGHCEKQHNFICEIALGENGLSVIG